MFTKRLFGTGLAIMLGSLIGCTEPGDVSSEREDVQEQREDLQQTKHTAAEDIEEERRQLQQEQQDLNNARMKQNDGSDPDRITYDPAGTQADGSSQPNPDAGQDSDDNDVVEEVNPDENVIDE